MGNLTTSLLNSASALGVFGRVFNVIQNNVTNANTPGYVTQDQPVVPLPFDPATGVSGGIVAGPLISARSQYLEQAVRNQQQSLGDAQQRASDLGLVQPLFDLSSTSSISSQLSSFFNSFSQLSVNPNDSSARQSVIDGAGQVAQSFNQTAIGINQVAANVDNQTRDVTLQINRYGQQIAALNAQFRANSAAASDAGLDAQMNAALENLSGLANFSVIKTNDGAVNVYLGGQTPLVIGDHQYQVAADFSSPQTAIRDSQGEDVTSQITSGQLGALLQEKNTTLPGYTASLNTLAQTFADQVNQQLSQGVDANGSPGANLFVYDQQSDAAVTLAAAAVTPAQIAAADSSAPGGNGNAIAIANLATVPVLGGFSFTQAYGNLGAAVGRDVAQAQQDQSTSQDLVAQAQQQRSQQTGVSLDAEAAKLLQFQQAYQAVAKMVTVLDDLTATVINMIPQS